jgi:hypothetical protein
MSMQQKSQMKEAQYKALGILIQELNKFGIPLGEPRQRLMTALRCYRNASVVRATEGIGPGEVEVLRTTVAIDRSALGI